MILIDDLNLDSITLHNEIPLSFLRGSLTFIKGPSGSGKTTLLYRVGLINPPDDYIYKFEDISVTTKAQSETIRKNEISFLFQNINMISYASVLDYLNIFASMNRVNATYEDFKKMLSKVNLDLDPKAKIATLSGGEKQRFCLACGLLKNPSVIIADEPTSALDKENADIIMDILRKLAKDDGKIVIISTHSRDYDAYAEVIYEIEDGLIKKKKDDSLGKSSLNTMQNVRNIKSSLSLYMTMMKLEIKSAIKHRKWHLLMSLFVIVSSLIGIEYGKVNEAILKEKLNNSFNNSLVLTLPLGQSDYNIETLQQIKEIESIYPIYRISTQVKIGNEFKNIEVYTYKGSFTNEFDSSFTKEIGQSVELLLEGSCYNIDVDKIFSDEKKKSFNLDSTIIILAWDNAINEEKVATNKYMIELSDFSYFDYVNSKLSQLFPEGEVSCEREIIQHLIDQQSSNQFYTILTISVINLILFIMLLAVQINLSDLQRKNVAIFRSNGLLRKELTFVKINEIIIYFIFYFMLGFICMILFDSIFIHKLILKTGVVKMLIILSLLIIVDVVIPNIVSILVIINTPIEQTLRSVVVCE